MTSLRRIRRTVAIVIAVAAAMTVTRAEEGFWPFTSIPRQKIRAALDVDLGDLALDHLRKVPLDLIRNAQSASRFLCRFHRC